jgi:hypothetical protein
MHYPSTTMHDPSTTMQYPSTTMHYPQQQCTTPQQQCTTPQQQCNTLNNNALPLKDDTSVEGFTKADKIDTLINRNLRGTNIGKRRPSVLVIDT